VNVEVVEVVWVDDAKLLLALLLHAEDELCVDIREKYYYLTLGAAN